MPSCASASPRWPSRPSSARRRGSASASATAPTEAIRRLTDIGVGSSFEERLERVERALEKLDEGSYGTCDVCGTQIPQPRLQAMPESVLCVTCAGAQRRAPRPRR